ncbi:MAG TPA: hypothetical protein VGJ53_13200 [Micromonosporaceae bacterium]|jgi:hypothetical protein
MRRLLSPAWIARHAAAALLVAGFLALGWWQFRRASGGNVLSWAYTFEWPVFAGFVAFIWYREVRAALPGDTPADEPPTEAPPAARRPVVTARRTMPSDDGGDPELAAYNKYLAWLNANPDARRTDYPG